MAITMLQGKVASSTSGNISADYSPADGRIGWSSVSEYLTFVSSQARTPLPGTVICIYNGGTPVEYWNINTTEPTNFTEKTSGAKINIDTDLPDYEHASDDHVLSTKRTVAAFDGVQREMSSKANVSALVDFCTKANAAETYLSKVDAADTYDTVANVNNKLISKLGTTEASETYETKAHASATYETKANVETALASKLDTATAASTYETKANVATELAKKLDTTAASTYETKSNATTERAKKIDKTSIADNLTTNDATKVLSAKQGKLLMDSLGDLKFENLGFEKDGATLKTVYDILSLIKDKLFPPYKFYFACQGVGVPMSIDLFVPTYESDYSDSISFVCPDPTVMPARVLRMLIPVDKKVKSFKYISGGITSDITDEVNGIDVESDEWSSSTVDYNGNKYTFIQYDAGPMAGVDVVIELINK